MGSNATQEYDPWEDSREAKIEWDIEKDMIEMTRELMGRRGTGKGYGDEEEDHKKVG